MSENKTVWLGIREESQLAGILRRLVKKPTISTAEVCKLWQQPSRDGGLAPLSPTRASFLLDALAEATEEGIHSATRINRFKGIMVLKKVRAAVRSTPGGTELDQGQSTRISMHAESVKITPSTTKPTVEDDLRGGQIVFPATPALPEARANFEVPDWYASMVLAMDNGMHVSIAGPPGIGKSTAPEQYFISRGKPFIVVNGDGGTRRRDLEGFAEAKAGTTSFNAAEFAAAAVFGWGAILNEVNACEPDALIMINGLLEVPHAITVHGKTYPVHKDFRLVITYNPGLTGTKPLPQSFKDRFFPIRLGFPGQTFLEKLLVANGMPADAKYGLPLVQFAARAWELHEKGNIRYQITPRRLFHTAFLMQRQTSDLRSAIRQAVLASVDSHSDREALEAVL